MGHNHWIVRLIFLCIIIVHALTLLALAVSELMIVCQKIIG
jgi:hypothetical protein